MLNKHILVIDDEPSIRTLLKEILEEEGYRVSVAKDAETARVNRQKERPDLSLLDLWLPDADGLTLLKEWAPGPESGSPVIVMTGHGTAETAVEALKMGAYDFIEKPLSTPKLLISIQRALENASLNFENTRLKKLDQELGRFVAQENEMLKLKEDCKNVANHNANILILGESGVGKETVARFIHQSSSSRDENFILLNFAGLTSEEQERQLFGFQSSSKTSYGALELAQKGTVFFKDISCLKPNLQAKLLRALENKVFFRGSSQEAIPLTSRIIASAKEKFSEMVRTEEFREDLFYQLSIVPLSVPPLRRRKEEIDELVDTFIRVLVAKENLPLRQFSKNAKARLKQYNWPGNLRELKNYVQRLLILGNKGVVERNEIEQILGSRNIQPNDLGEEIFQLPLKLARLEFEKAYLQRQLNNFDGNVAMVSEHIEIERTHLYRKLRSLNLDIKDSKKASSQ